MSREPLSKALMGWPVLVLHNCFTATGNHNLVPTRLAGVFSLHSHSMFFVSGRKQVEVLVWKNLKQYRIRCHFKDLNIILNVFISARKVLVSFPSQNSSVLICSSYTYGNFRPLKSSLFICYFILTRGLCVFAQVHTCQSLPVEVRGQFAESVLSLHYEGPKD